MTADATHDAAEGVRTDPGPAAPPDCLCMGLGPHLTALLRSAIATDAVAEHLRTGQLQVLEFIRALIDQRIASLSGQPAPDKGARVTIE